MVGVVDGVGEGVKLVLGVCVVDGVVDGVGVKVNIGNGCLDWPPTLTLPD